MSKDLQKRLEVALANKAAAAELIAIIAELQAKVAALEAAAA